MEYESRIGTDLRPRLLDQVMLKNNPALKGTLVSIFVEKGEKLGEVEAVDSQGNKFTFSHKLENLEKIESK